ncbi:MAG: FAD-dependent oxidoreductase [Burkholderiales bacterium]|nr:FAD-dependent oxidoreductase [Burkholderiales bacterium]
MTRRRWLLLLVLAAGITAFFTFGLHRYFTLAEVKSRQGQLQALFEHEPWLVAGGFFAAYLAMAALSLPGAVMLTVLAGAIFGVLWGTVIVSFASSLGATLGFLASRFLFRDLVQSRFGDRLAAINRGVQRDGAFYLFTLRLVPVFPFFLVNLLMGLTPVPTRTFYLVSQLGMFLGTVVYVNVGTQLARVDSLQGILSPGLLASFVALGVLPLVARRVATAIGQRKVYAPWRARRPARFDRNLVVIGAGSAGLVTAYIAAAVKASVTLIERHRMGGDCLNTGCVPSKALIRSARLLHQARRSQAYGIREMQVSFDFAQVMERVQRVITTIEPHDSVARYRDLGVDCVAGDARLISPWEVEVTEPPARPGEPATRRVISARNIVIATGARPLVPPIPGLETVGYLTSDTVWAIRELPPRLLVLGGGPIGCELAQCFARFGSKVTLVERAPRLLMREDPEVSALIAGDFAAEGIDLRLGHTALRFEIQDGRQQLIAEHDGTSLSIEFDTVLLALGRSPNTTGFGLEELGIATTAARTVEVDGFLRTRYPNIFACGDVAGPYQFTHTAAHMAWYAAVNALFGRWRRFPVDWSVVPWCTFTDPEVARVGLNETEAKAAGIAFEVTRYGIDDLDRAIADEAAHGFINVLTVPGSDRVLGVTIVGEHAGDLIAEYVAVMKNRIGLNRVLGTMHIYPTMAEANKYVAGEWKRAHAPQRVLGWLRRYHRWQL